MSSLGISVCLLLLSVFISSVSQIILKKAADKTYESTLKAVSYTHLDLKEKNIKASIDLKDKKEGTYEVVVDIEIPEGYELVDEVKTQIEVSRISKAEENS